MVVLTGFRTTVEPGTVVSSVSIGRDTVIGVGVGGTVDVAVGVGEGGTVAVAVGVGDGVSAGPVMVMRPLS